MNVCGMSRGPYTNDAGGRVDPPCRRPRRSARPRSRRTTRPRCWWTCSGEPAPRGARCSITATRPPVVSRRGLDGDEAAEEPERLAFVGRRARSVRLRCCWSCCAPRGCHAVIAAMPRACAVARPSLGTRGSSSVARGGAGVHAGDGYSRDERCGAGDRRARPTRSRARRRRGLPREQYFRELAARLRRVDRLRRACAGTRSIPQTRLMTSDAPRGADRARASSRPRRRRRPARLIVASEYIGEDFNTFAGLAPPAGPGRRSSVTTTRRPPGAQRPLPRRARSRRHPVRAARGVRQPRPRAGARSTSPAASTSGTSRAEDADALARVAGAIADGHPHVRCASTPPAVPRAPARPGSSSSARDEVELITPPARELLAAMRSPALTASEETPRGRCWRSPRSPAAAAPRRRAGSPTSSPSRARSAGSRCTPRCPTAARTAASRSCSSAAPRRTATALRLEAHGVDRARARGRRRCSRRACTNPEIAATLVLSPVHRPGPHQEPVREDRRRLAPGAGRTRLPRRLPAAARTARAAHRRRRLRGRVAPAHAGRCRNGCAGRDLGRPGDGRARPDPGARAGGR